MLSKSGARWRLLAAAALFSTGGAAIKGCLMSAWQVASLRSGIAAIAFLIGVSAARRLPNWREWLVGVAYASTLVLFVVANKLTTSANAIFLQSTAPIYILLAAPFLLGEKIRMRDITFMLVIAAGLACFFVDEQEPLASASNPSLGNWLALASGFFWGATVIGLRWLSAHTKLDGPPFGAIVAGNTLACVFCALPAASGGGLALMTHASTTSWLVVLYLGVFQIALAYLFVATAMRKIEAFEASLLLLIEPVLNPIWAFVFQGERPGATAIAGGVLILAATAFKGWSDARGERRAAVI
jgi:DME family drug/metabolite transporter